MVENNSPHIENFASSREMFSKELANLSCGVVVGDVYEDGFFGCGEEEVVVVVVIIIIMIMIIIS